MRSLIREWKNPYSLTSACSPIWLVSRHQLWPTLCLFHERCFPHGTFWDNPDITKYEPRGSVGVRRGGGGLLALGGVILALWNTFSSACNFCFPGEKKSRVFKNSFQCLQLEGEESRRGDGAQESEHYGYWGNHMGVLGAHQACHSTRESDASRKVSLTSSFENFKTGCLLALNSTGAHGAQLGYLRGLGVGLRSWQYQKVQSSVTPQCNTDSLSKKMMRTLNTHTVAPINLVSRKNKQPGQDSLHIRFWAINRFRFEEISSNVHTKRKRLPSYRFWDTTS